MKKIDISDNEWREKLTSEEFRVLREKGTEPPFTGKLLHNHEKGVYLCRGCGAHLFRSETKFDSGSGWPSFYDAIGENIELKRDLSLGMDRMEVICSNCGGHLGHLFDDGPEPTGERYCVNSVSLHFEKDSSLRDAAFGAGCFWHVEDQFAKVEGVVETEVGFMGGDTVNPTYQEVCTHLTGHAEVVHIKYDPSVVTYSELLKKFWDIHDPTQLDRQGPDIGDQYRSVIFCYSDEDMAESESSREAEQEMYQKPIVTKIEKASHFYRAEEYHQKYFKKKGK